ncbi:class E sortase [Nocardioides sp. YIM 152588]|uniref:class E sortase n=1 Tax=Nocardioides sp. YIM 152588 TaxID=3158259 RepID=UPI0032E448E6
MTQDELTEEPAAPETPARPRRRWAWRVLMALGLVMILVGLAILGWLGWQIWGTNWESARKQDEVTQNLERAWQDGEDTATTDFGDASAILRVPRFGDDFAVPVLEGSTDEVLAAGIGHVEGTGEAGRAGNYVLAAHRVTHGQPFADFPELRDGDRVIVQTRKATFTYELDLGGTDLILPFTDTWVLDPYPDNPGDGPTPTADSRRLITLITCSELFHTDNRSIVFGHLVDRTPAG